MGITLETATPLAVLLSKPCTGEHFLFEFTHINTELTVSQQSVSETFC